MKQVLDGVLICLFVCHLAASLHQQGVGELSVPDQISKGFLTTQTHLAYLSGALVVSWMVMEGHLSSTRYVCIL